MNAFHSLGDAYERALTRVCTAWEALTGKTPKPLTIEDIMTAIEELNASIAKVTAYLGTLQSEISTLDQTPAIKAATASLDALVPAPAPAPAPVM
jgi:hypothetical protein